MSHGFLEHDTVVLCRDYPDHGLRAGDVGAIVHVYEGADAFDVEFTRADGTPVAILTVTGEAVRPMRDNDLLHVRQFDSQAESRV